MKNRIVFAIAVSAIVVMTGCIAPETYNRRIGPFVTNVSSDGNGNLIVEKNMIIFNNITGVLTLEGNPTTQTYQAPAK